MPRRQSFPTREGRLAEMEEERKMVNQLLTLWRASIRCGCNPLLEREWPAFMFRYLGTHIPECPNNPARHST